VVTYDWNGNGVIEPDEDNYSYKYSITNAVNTLAALGFNDTDANGYLNYPKDAGRVAGHYRRRHDHDDVEDMHPR
jgi:hypothetical protein